MIIFVADVYKKDYVGGAELTSDAILQECPCSYKTFYSSDLTKKEIEKYKDCFWIFGNIASVEKNLLLHIAKNINYCVLEYDYKYCKYRSPQKHVFFEQECDCHNQNDGKIISIFFAEAKSLWFMSEGQKKHYEDMFPFLSRSNSYVLSSVFDSDTLKYMKGLKTNKNNKWLIIHSNSWIKGTEKALKYADDHNLKYFLASNLSYKNMLETMASHKGLIFLPNGMDTCPRTTIEAKLLDCELIINENVQHATEKWFISKESTFRYLENRTRFFWNKVKREA